MVDGMSQALLRVVPEHAGPYMGFITALASVPFTFFMSNDAFFFGILPILGAAAAEYGVDPIHIARASVLGLPVHAMSPLVAAPYLLAGLLKRDLGELQRYCLGWALGCSGVLIVGALVTGASSSEPLYREPPRARPLTPGRGAACRKKRRALAGRQPRGRTSDTMSEQFPRKVVVTQRFFDPESLAYLQANGCEVEIAPLADGQADGDLDEARLLALLADADAWIVGHAWITASLLAGLPRLKVIARRGVGYERVDVEAVRASGKVATIAVGGNDAAWPIMPWP